MFKVISESDPPRNSKAFGITAGGNRLEKHIATHNLMDDFTQKVVFLLCLQGSTFIEDFVLSEFCQILSDYYF